MNRLDKWRRRWLAAWWRWRLMRLATSDPRRLQTAPEIECHVPVRCDGDGLVRIGRGNGFGYHLAPRLGNGEILLQARTPDARITIGNNNHWSNNVSVIAMSEITVGDGCLIGELVSITDGDFHEIAPDRRHQPQAPTAPVTIGNNVWLGSRCMILKGVTIGDHSVIGAMSLVNKPIPPNCVAAGVPAKVIRTLA